MEKSVSATLALQRGIQTLYTEECLTDVIIEVQMRQFPCHRVILSAMSQYFRTMFTADFKDKQQSVIKLEGITSDVFESILRYIYYSREDCINANNVQEVHAASCMLLMPHVEETCEVFISNRLSSDNVMQTWRYASQGSYENLLKFSKEYFLKNFEKVVSEESFLQLTADELAEIVSDNKLNVPGEEIVGDAILKWFESDEKSRLEHLPKMFQHVKLPLADKLYVYELPKKNRIFSENAEMRCFTDEAKRFHCFVTKENESSSEQVVHRNTSSLTNALLYICQGNPQPFTYAYSFQEGKWIKLACLPDNPGHSFAVCLYKNDVCISGGTSNKEGDIMLFCTRVNKWKTISSLGRKIYRHAMVNASDKLYLIGGSTKRDDFLEEITEVNSLTEDVSTIGHLQEAVRSMAATLFGETIFILGGNTKDGLKSCIQSFNIFSKQCSLLDVTLPVPIGPSGAVRLDDKVLFFWNNVLYQWTPIEEVHEIFDLPFNYNSVNICTFQQKMYVHANGSGTTQNPLHAIHLDSLNVTDIESSADALFFRMIRCTIPKHFFNEDDV